MSDTFAGSQHQVSHRPAWWRERACDSVGEDVHGRPGSNITCGWERKCSVWGTRGFVGARVTYRVIYLPKSPQWLPTARRMEAQLPHVAHSAPRVCPTSRLLHTPYSLPVTLGPGLPTTQLC